MKRGKNVSCHSILRKDHFRDITVLCQGAVEPGVTQNCLQALRDLFTEAEIVLSTWAGADTAGLTYDKVIYSKDPGAVYCDRIAGTLNNVNRQLVSTQAGLQAATRPYILKTRTDILFESTSFLEYFQKYDSVLPPLFHNRLLICNYYTRGPRILPLCFHPSDWIVFGRAEDVRKYFGCIPLMTDKEGEWFCNRPKTSRVFTNFVSRFTPEQYIFLNFLRTCRPVHCSCYYEQTPELICQTEKAFAECFVVLDYRTQIAIQFTKYNPNRYVERHTLLSHWKWKALYQHYCKKQFSLLWICYLVGVAVMRCMTKARTVCVCCLDYLGWKEGVKRILSRICSGRRERK